MDNLLVNLLNLLLGKKQTKVKESTNQSAYIDWGKPTGNVVVDNRKNNITMAKANSPTPLPTNRPNPTPPPAEYYRRGFEKFGAPVASNADAYVSAQQQYPLSDPYMLAILSLMETGGGQHMKYKNNPLNWGMQDLPSIPYTVEHASSGIGGRMPYYKDYLNSGDISDFFKVYTPESDPSNPRNSELVDRYNKLRAYFPE